MLGFCLLLLLVLANVDDVWLEIAPFKFTNEHVYKCIPACMFGRLLRCSLYMSKYVLSRCNTFLSTEILDCVLVTTYFHLNCIAFLGIWSCELRQMLFLSLVVMLMMALSVSTLEMKMNNCERTTCDNALFINQNDLNYCNNYDLISLTMDRVLTPSNKYIKNYLLPHGQTVKSKFVSSRLDIGKQRKKNKNPF